MATAWRPHVHLAISGAVRILWPATAPRIIVKNDMMFKRLFHYFLSYSCGHTAMWLRAHASALFKLQALCQNLLSSTSHTFSYQLDQRSCPIWPLLPSLPFCPTSEIGADWSQNDNFDRVSLVTPLRPPRGPRSERLGMTQLFLIKYWGYQSSAVQVQSNLITQQKMYDINLSHIHLYYANHPTLSAQFWNIWWFQTLWGSDAVSKILTM